MIDLVKKAQRGDAGAYGELVRMNQDSFYRVARSRLRSDEDAADAIQEALLAGWEKRETLKEPAFFKTWMIRILINKCNEILRKQPQTESLDMVPEPYSRDMEGNIMFEAMLKNLSEGNRTVMELYYGEEYTVREIAHILDISEDAVKQRLVRGRKEVLKTYEKSLF